MNYISAESIGQIFGDRWLFRNVHFGLNEGEKIGLIGINGSGKSTFLKILCGLMPPSEGKVSTRKGLTIGYLGQNPTLSEEESVFDNVFSSQTPIISTIRQYEKLLLETDTHTEAYALQLATLTEAMNTLHAWDFESQIKEIVSRLGIGEYLNRPVKVLSGGQRKRVAMAKVLIETPEVLIMDEPTNHLDMETVEWLEALVNKLFKTLIIITHDRYFLDNTTNLIVEIEGGNLHKYKGNYAYYLEKKASAEQALNAEVEKAKNLMRKELDWIRRQPKARGTKAKYRIDAFEEIKEKAQSKKVGATMELSIKQERQGGKIMELRKLNKAFGTTPFVTDFSYVFKKGDKIGIVGKNGMGKSTLLNMMAGILPPDKGEVVVGSTTKIGYYTQLEYSPKADVRLIEVVKEVAEVIILSDGSKISASQFLTKFLFPPSEQYKYVSALSGGERRRLQLLLILIQNPNFLILDEPTNDLDIGTLNVLEEFLENFQGTLVLVSHDRYFMDRLVEHLFVFEGNGSISDFPGNYTDWREHIAYTKESQVELQVHKSVQVTQALPLKASKKLSYKEQKELEQIEAKLPNLENEKASLENSLTNPTVDHTQLMTISSRIQDLISEIDTLSNRWLELQE